MTTPSPTKTPPEWNEVRRLAKDSIAMFRLIIAAVNAADKKLASRGPVKSKIKPR